MLLRAILLLILTLQAQAIELLPAPAEMQQHAGTFPLGKNLSALAPTAPAKRIAEIFRDLGVTLQSAPAAQASFVCTIGEVKNPHGFAGAYQLRITPQKIELQAADSQGLLYGSETIRQLADNGSLPCCTINDWPAFPIRGFMLDTGRNYQTPALIKEQIEIMARYKYNAFHFHFTDNPGWRLESKIHPQVTAATSMSRQPGKFYTQAEFVDLLDFCKQRGIMMIPEMDIPGHSEALRKALGINSMNAPESRKIVKELLTELASLAPAADMPYIHIGTDEVRHAAEKVDGTYVAEMSAHVRSLGRKVIGWHKGLNDPKDQEKITQLWARTPPLTKNPFLDSRSTYINHMDPHEAVFTFLHRASCNVPFGNDRALGGVLCSWPDIRIENERDQITHNAIYPAMLAYAESVWTGVKSNHGERYTANLPAVGTAEFAHCVAFEKRLISQKQRFFTNENFPVYPQTQLRWKIIGPFPDNDDLTTIFPVEQSIQQSYQFDGKNYTWLPDTFGAATLYYTHFFGFGGLVKESHGTCYALTNIWSPDARTIKAFIGFHHSSRSDRRGNEQATPGEWHNSLPWIKINGEKIAPPAWKITDKKDNEIPFTDEDYQMRPPHEIALKQGWNQVLLKVPKHSKGWKWSSTFLPIDNTNGLRYSDELLSAP
jgi:hypothetical protein